MLGKLIKHELRHSARYTMVIYAAVVAAIVVMGISLLTGSMWLGVISCFALYVVGFAAVVVTLVSVIKNFYDTLFSRQGYLTLTLPVKGSTLLISKIIVSIIWIVVSFVAMGLTLLVIFYYGKERSGGAIESLWSVISMSGMLEALPSGAVIVQFIAVAAVLAISTIVTYVGYVYFTVTLANTRLLQKHPKFFGGMIFFFIVTVVNTVSTKLTELVPLTLNVSAQKVYFSFTQMGYEPDVLLSYGVGGIIFSALIAVGLLFATGYILEHKVNLK